MHIFRGTFFYSQKFNSLLHTFLLTLTILTCIQANTISVSIDMKPPKFWNAPQNVLHIYLFLIGVRI